MKRLEKLLQTANKRITDVELQQLLQEPDYERFYSIVESLVERGVLAPVKSSQKNGRIPPLFNKYHIIQPQVDYSDELESIRRLNPDLNISGYLQRPELYQRHRQIVEGISKYLWFAQDLLVRPMSRKERSFSVWSREKFLDEHMSQVKEVLKYNALDENFLNYYDTPEPFFEYRHNYNEPIIVLVIENKDTWFTLRKLMQETGKNALAGINVNVLLFGEGNKITKRGALEGYSAAMLSGQKEPEGQAPCFLYFGDLDWEGIRLFFRTREANPSLELRPCISLYRLMLELAKTVELPESPDQRGVTGPLSEFLTLLGIPEEQSLRALLAEGKYIPQEIVNYQVAANLIK